MEQAGKDMLPEVGTLWVWEPLKPRATQLVRVTEVRWVDNEWKVESEAVNGWRDSGERFWNDLSRWVEATVFFEGP